MKQKNKKMFRFVFLFVLSFVVIEALNPEEIRKNLRKQFQEIQDEEEDDTEKSLEDLINELRKSLEDKEEDFLREYRKYSKKYSKYDTDFVVRDHFLYENVGGEEEEKEEEEEEEEQEEEEEEEEEEDKDEIFQLLTTFLDIKDESIDKGWKELAQPFLDFLTKWGEEQTMLKKYYIREFSNLLQFSPPDELKKLTLRILRKTRKGVTDFAAIFRQFNPPNDENHLGLFRRLFLALSSFGGEIKGIVSIADDYFVVYNNNIHEELMEHIEDRLDNLIQNLEAMDSLLVRVLLQKVLQVYADAI